MYKYTGIDISKQDFDTFSLNTEESKKLRLKLDNNVTGFKELLKNYGKDSIYVMEASGPYHLQLATFLYNNGVKVCVLNPLITKRYSQMKLLRAKTDAVDAKSIFEYSTHNSLSLWEPTPVEINEMQQILTALELINKQSTALRNQLGAFKSSGDFFDSVKLSLNTIIVNLKKEKRELENKLQQIVIKHYNETKLLLESIPGIGPKASAVLIAITNNFTKFIHYKQLIAYVGLSPRIYTSGTSVRGKGHISKTGKGHVRKQMYISAWSAKFYNKGCMIMYERLAAKGKKERVIKIAIANKLLKQAFAIVLNQVPYNENFQSKLVH